MSQWRIWSQKLHQKAEVQTLNFIEQELRDTNINKRVGIINVNLIMYAHLLKQTFDVNIFLLYCVLKSPPPLYIFLALVPDSVKKELLQRIRAFLAQHATL